MKIQQINAKIPRKIMETYLPEELIAKRRLDISFKPTPLNKEVMP